MIKLNNKASDYECKAGKIVAKWIVKNLIIEGGKNYSIFVVWSCKTLQNYKCVLFTSCPNSPYFELTYDGDKLRWYLDVYYKLENKIIEESKK